MTQNHTLAPLEKSKMAAGEILKCPYMVKSISLSLNIMKHHFKLHHGHTQLQVYRQPHTFMTLQTL